MSLRRDFETSGSWLFRHRSYLGLTGLPLFFAGFASFAYFGQRHSWTEVWNVVCVLVSLLGFALRVIAVGHVPRRSSGRNTRTQAASCLNTTGVYSVVRHPLYLGNTIMVLGMALFFRTWWVAALVACGCVIYYERIIYAEESYLRICFGEDFERWAAATPTIIPNLALWKSPKLPFSWRSVLRREYTGLALVTILFPLLEVTGDSIAEKRLRFDWPWLVLAALGVLAYLVLRSLKKHTRCLEEAGR